MNGGDFRDLFKILWGDLSPLQENNSLRFSQFTSSISPLMHFDDIVAIICDLAFSSSHASTMPPFLNPAFDGYRWDIKEFLGNRPDVLEAVQKAACPQTDKIASSITDIMKYDSSKPNLTLIPSTVCSIEYPCGLRDSFDAIWTEFVTCNNLSPFRLVIVGPPLSGKSLCSTALSEDLGLPIVNTLSGVTFFLQSVRGDSSLEAGYAADLREKLLAEIEHLASDGKKKGEPFDVNSVHITDTMVQELSRDMQIKAIKFQTENDPICICRGYILDCWGSHMGSVSSIASLISPELAESENDDFVEPQSILNYIDLVLELKCSNEVCTERWMVSHGQEAATAPAKLPKELTAPFKAFETNLDGFSAKLVGVSDDSDVSSHEDVLKLANIGVRVSRVSSLEMSMEDIRLFCKNECLKKTTSFGWCTNDTDISYESSGRLVCEDVTLQESESSILHSEQLLKNVLSPEDSKYLGEECLRLELFSIETILPDLANLLISVARNRPDDPLQFAIESISAKAKSLEDIEEEKSKVEFLSLLRMSNEEINSQLHGKD